MGVTDVVYVGIISLTYVLQRFFAAYSLLSDSALSLLLYLKYLHSQMFLLFPTSLFGFLCCLRSIPNTQKAAVRIFP